MNTTPAPTKPPFWQRPSALGWVGLALLMMGFSSYFLVYLSDEVDRESVHLAAATGLLMSLAVSTICIAAIKRLEARVAALETGPSR